MPLTTYVAGDVLTASSLNDNFTFAAANPPAAAAGLAFISNTPFTTATSISLPNDTFTSTFTNYRIVVVLTALTTDADFTLRLRAAGSDATGSDYQTMFTGITAGAVASNQTGASQSSFLVGESDALLFAYSLSFDLFSPQLAQRTALVGGFTFFNKAVNASVSRTGGGRFSGSTAFDSLTFISSVASSMTGIITAYGYSES